MLVAAALCPAPPVLVPAVSRAVAHELDDVRAACAVAIAELLRHSDCRLVVVAAGQTRAWCTQAPAGLASVGLPIDVPPLTGPADGGPRLPLALTVGRWLLAQTGHLGGDDAWWTVDVDGAPALGRGIAASDERTTLLVLGEGSPANGPHAPLPQDDRAPAFDAAVADLVRDGDVSALGALDAHLATALGVTGWAPWQVLASAAGGRSGVGRLLSSGAPYGVGYVVGTWAAR